MVNSREGVIFLHQLHYGPPNPRAVKLTEQQAQAMPQKQDILPGHEHDGHEIQLLPGSRFVLPREPALLALNDNVSLMGGSFGVVVEGFDLQTKKPVMMKILREQEDFPVFLREARALRQLKHSNIAELVGFSMLLNPDLISRVSLLKPVIVLEKCLGEPLNPKHKNFIGQSMDKKHVLSVVTQIGSALDYLRGQHRLHLDVSPRNILYHSEQDVAKLIDFGLSVSEGYVGNLGCLSDYSAPEVLNMNQSLTPAADLYSLGCVAYYLLGGQLPEPFVLFQSNKEPVPAQHQYFPKDGSYQLYDKRFSPEILAILQQATAYEPEKRFATAGQFASELKRVLAK